MSYLYHLLRLHIHVHFSHGFELLLSLDSKLNLPFSLHLQLLLPLGPLLLLPHLSLPLLTKIIAHLINLLPTGNLGFALRGRLDLRGHRGHRRHLGNARPATSARLQDHGGTTMGAATSGSTPTPAVTRGRRGHWPLLSALLLVSEGLGEVAGGAVSRQSQGVRRGGRGVARGAVGHREV